MFPQYIQANCVNKYFQSKTRMEQKSEKSEKSENRFYSESYLVIKACCSDHVRVHNKKNNLFIFNDFS